jgi:hypothetical protein
MTPYSFVVLQKVIFWILPMHALSVDKQILNQLKALKKPAYPSRYVMLFPNQRTDLETMV